MLGCVQPGEAPAQFADALRRLVRRRPPTSTSTAPQYWYSLQPNVTRLAADRAASNFTDDDADDEIKRRLQAQPERSAPFAAVHVFPDGPGDVPDDDDGVRLVVLPTTAHHVPNDDESPAITLADADPRPTQRGPAAQPQPARVLRRIRSAAARTAGGDSRSTWRGSRSSRPRRREARPHRRRPGAGQLEGQRDRRDRHPADRRDLPARARPRQTPGTREISWHQTKPTGDRKPCRTRRARSSRPRSGSSPPTAASGSGWTSTAYRCGPTASDVDVDALWKAYCQFPYMPRLASFDVLVGAISDGISKLDWQTETFAYADGHDGDPLGRPDCRPTRQRATRRFSLHPDIAQEQIDADKKAARDGEPGDGEAAEADDGSRGRSAIDARAPSEIVLRPRSTGSSTRFGSCYPPTRGHPAQRRRAPQPRPG